MQGNAGLLRLLFFRSQGDGKQHLWVDYYQKHLQQVEFLIGWKIQSWLSTLVLLLLMAFSTTTTNGLVIIILTAVGWGMLATTYYEWRRHRGIPDLYVSPNRLHRSQDILGWGWFLIKVIFFLGPKEVLITRRLSHLYSRDNRSENSRRVIYFLGTSLFGIIASRHFLEKASYTRERIYRLNLLARVTNTPFHLLEVLFLYQVYAWVGVIPLLKRLWIEVWPSVYDLLYLII